MDFESADVAEHPEHGDWSLDTSALQRVISDDVEPRPIPARFKKKTIMSRVFPRSASKGMAKLIGYGFGVPCIGVGVVLFLGNITGLFPTFSFAGYGFMGFGFFLIAMAQGNA